METRHLSEPMAQAYVFFGLLSLYKGVHDVRRGANLRQDAECSRLRGNTKKTYAGAGEERGGTTTGYSVSGGLTYSPTYQQGENWRNYNYGAGATANMSYKDGQYMGMTTSSYVSAVFDEEKYKNGLKQDSITKAKQNDAQNATALNYQNRMKMKESGYSAQTTQGVLIGVNASPSSSQGNGTSSTPTNNYGFANGTWGQKIHLK